MLYCRSSPRKPRSYRPRKSRHNAQLAGRPLPPEKMRETQQLPRNAMWSPSQQWCGWPRYPCRMSRNRSEEHLRGPAWPFTHAWKITTLHLRGCGCFVLMFRCRYFAGISVLGWFSTICCCLVRRIILYFVFGCYNIQVTRYVCVNSC